MLLSAEGQPPAGSPAQDPAETGRIRGRVVDDGTGAPIADAQVSLSAGGGIRLSALTDADGRYEFSTLVPAGYSASARQSGYVGGFSGTFSTAVAGRSASVAAGQTLDNVDFRLARAAIVNGVVTDVDRAPAAGIDIHVLHHVYLKGRWRFVSIARTTTGTNGEYWIEDLRPGRYYLLARPRQAMSMLNQTVQGYAPTYYPGAHLPASAERIAVYEGPVNTFDVALAVVPFSPVSGRVVGADGTPASVPWGVLQVLGVDDVTGTTLGTMTIGADGRFRTPPLAAGTYVLRLEPSLSADVGFTTVTKSDDRLDDVEIVFAERHRIPGRLVAALGETLDVPPGGFVAARSVTADFGSTPHPGIVEVDDRLTFEVSVVPGHYVLEAPQPGGWWIDAITLGGRDVTDGGTLARSGDGDEIVVVLTRRQPEVSGRVTDEAGVARPGSAVIVFPRNADLWANPARHVRARAADGDGRFVLAGLPPGEYYAAAVARGDAERLVHPDVFRVLAEHAVPLDLSRDERRTIDLREIDPPL